MSAPLSEDGTGPTAIDRALVAFAEDARRRAPAYFEGRAGDTVSLDDLVGGAEAA